MKRLLTAFIAAALAASALLCSAGCDNGSQSSAPESSQAQTTAPAQDDTELELGSIHKIDENGDAFAGAWKITEGTGAKLKSFIFVFDGNGKAYLTIGSTGYCENYKLDASKKQFTAQLMFGLNGKYTYEFSEDGGKVVMTNTEDKSKTTMEKQKDYSPLPEPKKDFKTDKELLGAWKDESGEYLYFDKSGIMYENQLGLSFVFYAYSAQNGKCAASYYMPDETSEEVAYKIDGDTMTYNNYKYTRVAVSEMKEKIL